jgi:hypothetical protein
MAKSLTRHRRDSNEKKCNPLAGLTAIVVLKTTGEIFEVWATRIK